MSPTYPTTPEVGRRLRRMRLDADLTIEALAERAGVQPETVARIERGSTSTSLRTLGQLAHGLGVPTVAFFWGGTEAPLTVCGVPAHLLPVLELLATRPEADARRAERVLRAMFSGE